MEIEIIETKKYLVTYYTEEELEMNIKYYCFGDATEFTKEWIEDDIGPLNDYNDWDYLTENADSSERMSIKVNKIKIIKEK